MVVFSIFTWWCLGIITGLKGVFMDDDCNKYNLKCCYNYYFDEKIGSCTVCKTGRFGWHCSQRCIKGYYGYLCKSKCYCEAHLCNLISGCPANSTSAPMLPSLETKNTALHLNGHKESFLLKSMHTTPTQNGKYQHYNNWMLVSFLMIGALGTALIGGVLLYFRTSFWSKNSSRKPPAKSDNILRDLKDRQSAATSVDINERSNDYEAIRESHFNISKKAHDKSNFRVCEQNEKSSFKNDMKHDEYGKFGDGFTYSCLKLKKFQSTTITGMDPQKDEDYVLLNLSRMKECSIQKEERNFCTLPRILQIDDSSDEKTTQRSYSLVRCTSESQLLNRDRDCSNPLPNSR